MPSSRYGTVLSNAQKRSNTIVKVYKMTSLLDIVTFQDEYIFTDTGPVYYPSASDNEMFDPFMGELFPGGGVI